MCPDEYRSVASLRTIKCQVLMQLMDSDQPVLMTDIEAELDPILPFAVSLIDENGKAPADGQWHAFLVNVATAVFRLTRPAVREKFIVAVHHGLFSTNRSVQIEEEDLWSMSLVAVLMRIADPTLAPVRNPERFLFATARNLFQNEVRRLNHERSLIQEALSRSAMQTKRRDWLRGRGIADLAADVENELPRFVADKMMQQTRSRRTRAVAEARMKGFALVVEMLLRHPDRSLDACRLKVERIAARINRYAPTTFAIVPGRSTFFRWMNELVSRIRLRADRRVVFPYTERAASF